MGPFITAYVGVHGHTHKSRTQAARWLAVLDAHLRHAGLGQVSEIFDGDVPHRPRGCIAQAWGTAEVLPAVVEDVYGIMPATRRAVAAV
jgi:glycogen debranching enzyme